VWFIDLFRTPYNIEVIQEADRLAVTQKARIKDLEQTAEALIGANSILERELEKAQVKEGKLLEKVFQISGIGEKSTQPVAPNPSEFRNLAKHGTSWNKVRQSLESKSMEDYWTKKKAEEEVEERKRLDEIDSEEEKKDAV
jgi:hypothetical protein